MAQAIKRQSHSKSETQYLTDASSLGAVEVQEYSSSRYCHVSTVYDTLRWPEDGD